MQMEHIANAGIAEMVEVEFLLEIVQQMVLNDQYQMLADVLQRFNFMVKLDENRFRSHLPVDPERLGRFRILGRNA